MGSVVGTDFFSTGGSTAATHTVVYPAGRETGDVLLCWVRSAGGGPSLPASWETVYSNVSSSSQNSERMFYLVWGYKVVDGTEGTSVTISKNYTAAARAVHMSVYLLRNVDPTGSVMQWPNYVESFQKHFLEADSQEGGLYLGLNSFSWASTSDGTYSPPTEAEVTHQHNRRVIPSGITRSVRFIQVSAPTSAALSTGPFFYTATSPNNLLTDVYRGTLYLPSASASATDINVTTLPTNVGVAGSISVVDATQPHASITTLPTNVGVAAQNTVETHFGPIFPSDNFERADRTHTEGWGVFSTDATKSWTHSKSSNASTSTGYGITSGRAYLKGIASQTFGNVSAIASAPHTRDGTNPHGFHYAAHSFNSASASSDTYFLFFTDTFHANGLPLNGYKLSLNGRLVIAGQDSNGAPTVTFVGYSHGMDAISSGEPRSFRIRVVPATTNSANNSFQVKIWNHLINPEPTSWLYIVDSPNLGEGDPIVQPPRSGGAYLGFQTQIGLSFYETHFEDFTVLNEASPTYVPAPVPEPPPDMSVNVNAVTGGIQVKNGVSTVTPERPFEAFTGLPLPAWISNPSGAGAWSVVNNYAVASNTQANGDASTASSSQARFRFNHLPEWTTQRDVRIEWSIIFAGFYSHPAGSVLIRELGQTSWTVLGETSGGISKTGTFEFTSDPGKVYEIEVQFSHNPAQSHFPNWDYSRIDAIYVGDVSPDKVVLVTNSNINIIGQANEFTSPVLTEASVAALLVQGNDANVAVAQVLQSSTPAAILVTGGDNHAQTDNRRDASITNVAVVAHDAEVTVGPFIQSSSTNIGLIANNGTVIVVSSPILTANTHNTSILGLSGRAKIENPSTWDTDTLTSNPLYWWRLDELEGSVAVDTMGIVNATYVNSPTLGASGIPATANGAISLTGSQSIDVGGMQSTIPRAISLFYKGTAASGALFSSSSNPISGGSFSPSYRTFYLLELSSGRLRVEVQTGSSTGSAYHDAENIINDNKWHHIVLSGRNVFLDGKLIVSAAPALATHYAHKYFGVEWRSTGGGSFVKYLNGSLDELIVYDRTLTLTEVNTLFLSSEIVNPDVTVDVTDSNVSVLGGANVVRLNANVAPLTSEITLLGEGSALYIDGALILGATTARLTLGASAPVLSAQRDMIVTATTATATVFAPGARARLSELSFTFIESSYTGVTARDATHLQLIDLGPVLHGQGRVVRFRLGNTSDERVAYSVSMATDNKMFAELVGFSTDNGQSFYKNIFVESIPPNGISNLLLLRVLVPDDLLTGRATFKLKVETTHAD